MITRNALTAVALVALVGCETSSGGTTSPTNTPPANTPPVTTADAGAQPPVGADVPQTPPVRPTPVTSIPGHENLPQDNTPKEPPRLVPAEALMRSYMQLFGGLAPLRLQERLRGTPGTVPLFDTWVEYLAALGVPDYAADIPRSEQSNALMLAAFERIGVALCDRAVENDLRGSTALASRAVFRFDLPAGRAVTDAEFDTRFDRMHRLFLGYPASLAPTDRVARFRTIFREAAARRTGANPVRSNFNASEAGWAVVCYGLIRHPEFHLY